MIRSRYMSISVLILAAFVETLPASARARESAASELLSLLNRDAAAKQLEHAREARDQAIAVAGLGGTGLPMQGTVLHGLTQYLATRARDELLIWYVSTISVDIKKRFGCLMPSTFHSLEILADSDYRTSLPVLRSSLAHDLDEMPLAVTDCAVVPRLRLSFRLAIRLYHGVRQSQSPIQAIALWADSSVTPELAAVSSRSEQVLLLAGVVARELAAHREWLEDSIPDTALMQIRKTAIAELYTRSSDSLAIDNMGAFVAGTSDMIRRMRELDTNIRKWLPRSATDVGAVQTIQSALGSLRSLLRDGPAWDLANHRPEDIEWLDLAFEVEFALAEGSYSEAMERVLQALKLGHGSPDSLSALERVAAFGSALASSRSADDIDKTLKAFTLPATSYKSKRQADDGRRAGLRLGLNAYLGAAAGWESKRDTDFTNAHPTTVGLAAPIGFEGSIGARVPWTCSYSVFATAIDIGQLVQAYSAHEDSLSQANDVRLQDVVSPGLYLVWGFTGRHAPLSLGAGYSITPNLRIDKVNGARVDVQRLSVFLGVDMPLWRF